MDRPLKIGILCHPTYGGSGVLASELALALADRGHAVHLFSHQVPPRLAMSSGPVKMQLARALPYPLFSSPPHDLALTSAILDVHRAEGLDILHAHYAVPHAVSAYLARAAAATIDSRPPPRVVTTLHGTDITLVGSDPSYAPLIRFAIGASDAVTAVSHSLRQATLESFSGVAGAPCEIEVVPNFVDTDRFRPAAAERARNADPLVVHVSNFRAVKRVDWVVEAFALASRGGRARLTLVGDGPELARARQLVRELEIEDRTCFLGERDALPELLAPADVFLLASREESFGLSALEAMSCGVPVVATDAGGLPEVVVHGRTGLLSPAGDKQALGRSLAELLGDRDRAAAMGRAARALAVERFQTDRVVPLYEDLYRRALEREACPA